MPVALSYPGVYVQEVPSGVRTIVGVPTAITLFIGSSADGPVGKPVLCLNYSDFARAFSEDITADHHLPRAVRLYFINGGQQCWVVRVAAGALKSQVTLRREGPAAAAMALTLTAKNEGVVGDFLRASVDYNTEQPEATFNVELFRAGADGAKSEVELWRNLSMNPASPAYAPTVLTQNSKLVDAAAVGTPTASKGVSIAMRPLLYDTAAAATNKWDKVWNDFVNSATAPAQQFRVSLGGRRYVTVDLGTITFTGSGPLSTDSAPKAIAKAIIDGYKSAGIILPATAVTVDFLPVNLGGTKNASLLRIQGATEDVFVQPGTTKDAAGPLMLGTAQGGLEIGAFAAARPAPTGDTLQPSSDPSVTANVADNLLKLYGLTHDKFTMLQLAGVSVPLPTGMAAGTPLFPDPTTTPPNGGILQRLKDAVTSLNTTTPPAGTPFQWNAALFGYRLTVRPTGGDENAVSAISTTDTDQTLANSFSKNVRYYSLGTSGGGAYQGAPSQTGSDGGPPTQAEYDTAFNRVDQDVDIFNLLVLPPDTSSTDMSTFWGPASAFCDRRRAFLLMDAPLTWTDVTTAQAGVNGLRIGLVKDHAGLFFPRVTIDEKGIKTHVGAAGAAAGLMARIDGERGVWKAPAGTEADLRGVVGIERRFSDPENGILNPKAINTIRVFPNGIVNWGARTMDGDDQFQSEYKYMPIRRTALFIEESLYRGLKWVVFEPNDEPLWAQIRLNVGAFMNSLFRQGAFQGTKPSDAYFVRCDAETTTQDDRNRGIVNIWVGFAPLKPAEFVVLYLQQMAGQIQV